MPDGLMAQLWGGSAGDIAARSTGRALEPRLRGAGRASQPLVLGRGRRRFAHLRLAVCTRAIADAIAAAGLVRRCRRLWLPALVARGYDADLAAVVARPRRRHRRVAAAGYGHRPVPSRGNAGSLAPPGCVDHDAEPLRHLAHGP